MSNVMWHVALEPGTTKMQDVIVANIEVDDFQTINFLLSTNHLKGKVYEMERGSYLLMYGGEYVRPVPSLMLWKLEVAEDGDTIVDMTMEDAWILEHAWRQWLMPEDTDAAFDPPDEFVVMARASDRESFSGQKA